MMTIVVAVLLALLLVGGASAHAHQARLEAASRAWWVRHPRAERAGRIIVVTIAIVFGTLVAGIVLPLLPPVVFGAVGIFLFLRTLGREFEQARRERQELRAAVARLEARGA